MVVAEVGTSLSVSIISSSFSMQTLITATKTSFIYLSEYFGTSLRLTVNWVIRWLWLKLSKFISINFKLTFKLTSSNSRSISSLNYFKIIFYFSISTLWSLPHSLNLYSLSYTWCKRIIKD
jgi:hypothetical protein